MPLVTEFIDQMREAFGKDEIDRLIAAGIKHGWQRAHGFHATENGHEIGHKMPEPKGVMTGGQWSRLSKLIAADQRQKESKR